MTVGRVFLPKNAKVSTVHWRHSAANPAPQKCKKVNGDTQMKKLMGFFSVAGLCLVVAGCGEPAASTAPSEAPATPPTTMPGDRESGVAGHGADAAAPAAEGAAPAAPAAEGAAPAAPAAEGAAPAAPAAEGAAPAAEGAAPAADAPKAE